MENSKEIVNAIRKSGFFDDAWYMEKYRDVVLLKIDPIEHYLTIGATLRRDPSATFSTGFYLDTYEDVAKNGINPLLHYISLGKKEGRLPLPNSSPINQAKKIETSIFISCWLSNTESIHDGLILLKEQLKQKNIFCRFITSNQYLLDNEDNLALKFSFSTLGNKSIYLYQKNNEPPPHWLKNVTSSEISRLLNQGQEINHAKKIEIGEYVNKAYSYWIKEITDNKCKFFLIWGSSSPLSKLHIGICQELGIFYYIIERGHFPKTLSIDINGQFGSGLANQLPVIKNWPHDDNHEELIKWVKSDDEVPFSEYNKITEKFQFLINEKKSGKKLLLVIGSNDFGAEILKSSSKLNEQHTTLFSSSKEMFEYVLKILPLLNENVLLILKPHPSDKTPYASSDRVVVCNEENINKLIEISDACIALTTTAIARCIVEEKPIILCSASDFFIKNIAYDCTNRTSILLQIRSALDRFNFEEKRKNSFIFLSYLFRERLVGILPETPTRLHIKDIADFIHEKKNAYFNSNAEKIETAKKYFSTINFYEKSVSANRFYIVIPIYGDVNSTKSCIDSVIETTRNLDTKIVLIFDASPYIEVKNLIDSYSTTNKVLTIYNEFNLGFSGTVNKGLNVFPDEDCIILNSDALTTGDWATNLCRAAYSAPNIATVTPFSNSAGLFSYSYPKTSDEASIQNITKANRLLEKNSALVEVPVGHGFCMYIKRICIKAIGHLDEVKFGRGYSEEVDYCLRARMAGMINVCATNICVGHIGGTSFGDESNNLRLKNRKIIADEYPFYFEEIKEFIEKDPLKKYRIQL